MTMAKVKSGEVVEVGLPDSLTNATPGRLYHYGWRPILGKPKPKPESLDGCEYTSPYTYDPKKDVVYGTWQQTDVKSRIWREARNDAKLTRAEFKMALLDMGELDAAKSLVESPDTDARIRIFWEDLLVFERTDSNTLLFAEAMGYSDQKLDALFGIRYEPLKGAL